MLEILLSEIDGWRKIVKLNNTLWIKGVVYNKSDTVIFQKLINLKITEIKSFLAQIDGHYAIILKKNNDVILAVDAIASIPILYSKIKSSIIISQSSTQITNLRECKFNPDSVLPLAMSGYTIGQETIYKNINLVEAGHFVILNLHLNNIKISSYHKFSPWLNHYDLDYESLRKKLIDLNLKIIKKCYDYSIKKNKKIAIPLSAGYDSRLIVSTLKQLGATNVITFSYGLKSNFEATAAKQISNYLGYKWYFVNLNHNKVYLNYKSKQFNEYIKKNENGYSIIDYSEFTPIKELSNLTLLKDSIIINGQAGDFISGGHTLHKNFLVNKKNFYNNQENVFNCIINKHYSLWQSLKNKKNINKIVDSLKIQLKKNNLNNDYYFQDNLNYIIIEFLEYYNRQSKYITSRQRVYEFFGHEWALPLWDREYINFWERIPFQFKLNQKLYLDALVYSNLGNVWGKKWVSLKTNLRISPFYFRFFIRPLFKIIFFFISKKRWHNFEKKFIYYWTDNNCGIGIKKYIDILKETKGFRNSVSFNVADYLYSKNIDFNKNIKFKHDKSN